MSKQSIRNKIKETKLKTKIVHVSAWGEDVEVRELNGKQYTQISAECVDKKNNLDVARFLVLATLYSVYSEGEQVFENEEEVANLPADVYSELVTAINDINEKTGASKRKN